MADFTKVAKEYSRMCSAHPNCYCYDGTNKCPIDEAKDKSIICRYWTLVVDPEKAEEVIMKWAKEHPPVSNLDKFKEVFGFDPLADKHLMCATPIVGWFGKEYKETIKRKQNG